MATINTARRHGDYPVEINGEFAKRVQSIDLTKDTPTQPYDELGNWAHAGLGQDPAQYNINLRWFPIDNQIELLLRGLSGSSGSSVSLKNWIDLQNGVLIRTPRASWGSAQCIGVEYNITAPGEFQGTMRLQATSRSDSTNDDIVVIEPSGVGCYKTGDVKVEVNGTTGLRVSGLAIRCDIPNDRIFELNNPDPVGTVYDSPNVNVDIDFYESDAIAGNVVIPLSAPADIVVNVGNGAKIITCKNMVSTTQNEQAATRTPASRRYSYVGKGDASSYGLIVS